MEALDNEWLLSISMNWVTLENKAFESRYTIMPDAREHTFENPEVAETLKATFIDKRLVAMVKLLADHTWMEVL